MPPSPNRSTVKGETPYRWKYLAFVEPSYGAFCSVFFGSSFAAKVARWIDLQAIKKLRFSAAILRWFYRIVNLVILTGLNEKDQGQTKILRWSSPYIICTRSMITIHLFTVGGSFSLQEANSNQRLIADHKLHIHYCIDIFLLSFDHDFKRLLLQLFYCLTECSRTIQQLHNYKIRLQKNDASRRIEIHPLLNNSELCLYEEFRKYRLPV